MGDIVETEDILEVLHEMVRGRNSFLCDRVIRSVPFMYRSALVSRYMINESRFMELITQIYRNNINRVNAAQTLITLSFPSELPPGFMDAVAVVPTQQQIESTLQNCPATTSSCAVCQDAVSASACMIRQCEHVFHRSCIESWLSVSVHCPVCRHDIREENLANQTSSAS
jgi:hypothetical protein